MNEKTFNEASIIAKEFHETYELFAPAINWQTQEKSRVPWEDLPWENRSLMMVVVLELLARGVIRPRHIPTYEQILEQAESTIKEIKKIKKELIETYGDGTL